MADASPQMKRLPLSFRTDLVGHTVVSYWAAFSLKGEWKWPSYQYLGHQCRRAGTDEGLDLGERQPLLVLILAAPVAIARLALFVGFKEENLYKTFFGIKPHGQIRSIV